ncbi:MAG TPA: Na+/H+ antiporter subunit E [Syntrophomonadaceae bacterium]|nr:Na+/H+ antiporter subunit E [Syntrophomonadaceae bacterium]
MPMQILINLFIGLLWMLLQDRWDILTFFTGYLVGLFILFILRRFLADKFYPITFIAALNLLFIFMYELFTSAIFVAKRIIQPKINVTPGIFMLETDLRGDVEITLVSLLITLTPGSVVMEVSSDNKLFIHGMDIPESIEGVTKSKVKFEKAIKRVTRK